MLQAVITRMANNSFLLKGWAITLLAGMVSLNLERLTFRVGASVFLVLFMFGGLDAYYLYLERAFRKLYTRVVNGSDTQAVPVSKYSMDISPFMGWHTYKATLTSPSIWAFYGPLLSAAILLVALALDPQGAEKSPQAAGACCCAPGGTASTPAQLPTQTSAQPPAAAASSSGTGGLSSAPASPASAAPAQTSAGSASATPAPAASGSSTPVPAAGPSAGGQPTPSPAPRTP